MRIRLTRISNDHHRLEVERADGTRDAVELETRSVLLHDLVHFAVEREAGLRGGFWGSVAAGASFASLPAAMDGEIPSPELALAESLAGPIQALCNGRASAEGIVEHFRASAPFVDAAFLERVLDRVRRLRGHWRGTPFHQSMELTWDEPCD